MKGKIYIQRTFFSRFKLPHVTELKDQISACICFDVKPQMLHKYNVGVLEKVLWPEIFSCLFSEVCSVDCGTHGVCMGGACRCEEGWTGAGCDQRVCNPLCIKHGTCKDGKCQCHQGWNGEHCTIGQHLCVSVCTCERVWCLPAYQQRGWAEAPSQTLLWQLLCTSLREFRNEKRLRKADHKGFARECWRDGRIERESVSIRIKLTSVTVVPRAHGGTKAFSYRTWSRTWSHGQICRC